MKLNIEFNPDIVALMKAEVAAGEKAVSAAMREAGTSLKSAWRGQITGAGLGTRLGNSIRLASFPQIRRQPERGGTRLVKCPGHHRRA